MASRIAPNYTDEKVSNSAGLRDDKNFYQVPVAIQPSNPGIAVIDAETDSVVWVITLRIKCVPCNQECRSS
jgi:hypothetical protein